MLLQVLTETFDIAAAIVEYNSDLSDPAIVVVFEHDDVTGVSSSIAGYGDVQVTHFTTKCRGIMTDSIGDEVYPPAVLSSAPLSTSPPQTIADSVQTTILYDFDDLVLHSDFAGIQSLDTNTDPSTVSVPFCVRLSLLDLNGQEVSFREADIDIMFPENDATAVTTDVMDSNPSQTTEDIGALRIRAEFCSDIPSPLAQGESFEVCLTPINQSNTPTPTVSITVDEFVFFIDDSANDAIDVGETSQSAVVGRVVVDGTEGLACGDGISGVARVHGCRFSSTLRPDFFEDNEQTVKGKGAVTMSFFLNRAGENRVVALELEIEGRTSGPEEVCGSDCSFPFCWLEWLWCFLGRIFL